MVIMFYKPVCIYHESVQAYRRSLLSIMNTECNQSDYRKLIYICEYNLRYGVIEKVSNFSVFSGNKQDVDFFKYLVYDSKLRTNDISIIPNIEFTFKDERGTPVYMLSFPIEYEKK